MFHRGVAPRVSPRVSPRASLHDRVAVLAGSSETKQIGTDVEREAGSWRITKARQKGSWRTRSNAMILGTGWSGGKTSQKEVRRTDEASSIAQLQT